MSEILFGTCGYYYHSWKGIVYPENTKSADYLCCYSKIFPVVELNYTYYGMPKASSLEKMLIDAGENLRFTIKAVNTLTHKIEPDKWKDEAKIYREAITPMLEAKRLDAVLFQFPYSFKYIENNRTYIDELLDFFNGVPAAVEFRKDDWFTEKIFNNFKNRSVTLVDVDLPDLPKLPSKLAVQTSPLVYIRLHGRRKTWWDDNETTRYDYFYSESELLEWAERIKNISVNADRTLVFFNNVPRGQAVENAKTLEKILGAN